MGQGERAAHSLSSLLLTAALSGLDSFVDLFGNIYSVQSTDKRGPPEDEIKKSFLYRKSTTASVSTLKFSTVFGKKKHMSHLYLFLAAGYGTPSPRNCQVEVKPSFWHVLIQTSRCNNSTTYYVGLGRSLGNY